MLESWMNILLYTISEVTNKGDQGLGHRITKECTRKETIDL